MFDLGAAFNGGIIFLGGFVAGVILADRAKAAMAWLGGYRRGGRYRVPAVPPYVERGEIPFIVTLSIRDAVERGGLDEAMRNRYGVVPRKD